MTHSAIDTHYRERTWIRYDVFPMQGEESAPTRESSLTVFSSDSGKRDEVDARLERLSEDQQVAAMDSYLVWDYELLAADAIDLSRNGGSAGELTKEWNGHPVGSIVMEVYVKAERGVSFAVFVAA